MRNTVFVGLCSGVAAFFIIWLLGMYVSTEINPFSWPIGGRFVHVWGTIMTAVASSVMFYATEVDSR